MYAKHSSRHMPAPPVAAAALLLAPASAIAAQGVTLTGALLGLVVFGALGWALWAIYFFSPLRQRLRRSRARRYWIVLLAVATLALAAAALSVLLGKTTIGRGVVVRELEPQWFWTLVKLQFGSGCVLLVVALLARKLDA